MPPSPPSAAEGGAGRTAGDRSAGWWLAAAAGAVLLLGCSSFVHRLREREPFRRVSPDIAFTMLRDVPALGVIDLREPEEFAGPEGHLRGALNLP
ncbi:MAG: rhodanese-like domain-containing protein, partial [Thermoanaerobaculia bacterium]|nr:rhodanese-like domain-containing protein [Thermoanaerobaculia bacterium]